MRAAKARPSISQALRGFFFTLERGDVGIGNGFGLSLGWPAPRLRATSEAGVASTRSRVGETYSTLIPSRLNAWSLSFFMTTSTGRIPCWFGLSLPKASRACAAVEKGSAAIVSFSTVWRLAYDSMARGSKGFSLSAPKALTILRRRTARLGETLIFLLYRALQWGASPFILMYFLARVLKDRRYLRRFHQRLGFLPDGFQRRVPAAVWLHAVSVGEVLASVELVRRLRAEMPWAPVYVSVATLAGRAVAEEKLAGLAEGVFFAPLDYCFAVRRVLRTIRPSVVVVAETEIWPNLYREAKRAGCGLCVVGGRISGRAYPRYRRLAWFFRPVLGQPDVILAQDAMSRERYLALGAPAARTHDGGNLKYDFQPSQAAIPEAVAGFLERTRPGEIWIAASTMPPAGDGDIDEDGAVVAAFHALAAKRPKLLLVLAPRRPARFDAVAAKLESAGMWFVRRSRLAADSPALPLPGVLLLDTIGELSSLFSLPSVVFMGGSLAARGGHNILEPAFFGRPVIAGPHMENFAAIAAEFEAGGGLERVGEAAELAGKVDALLGDPERRAAVGERARRLAEAKRGATARAAAEITALHRRAVPAFPPPFPVCQALRLPAWLWRLGSAWKRRRESARAEHLSTPVVSVGSLSMGGSGKTPFVLWLAGRLKSAGRSPAILTRGYRRRAPERQTVVEAGARVPVDRTGDEAQIFVRAGVAPVGIGADRASTGRIIEDRFHPDVFLLDDGFQHWRLARDVDIVLVDALDPFGGGAVFPLGRLREPLPQLRRASAFVITRTEPGRSYDGIEERLRRYNPAAPVFRARVRAGSWVEAASGAGFAAGSLPAARVAAFCALANPAAFWQTLGELGIRPLVKRVLGDHHRYRPVELKRLAAEARIAGAEALVTTEKDAMNLCAHVADLIAPLRLFWLKIGIEVEDEARLLELVLRAGSRR